MAADKIIGTMACWSCKREVPVKKKRSGKLSIACLWCDMPHYANEGTEHYANVLKDPTYKPIAGPELDQVKEPHSVASNKPAPAPAKDTTAAPATAAQSPKIAAPRTPAPEAPKRTWAGPLFGNS